ncbi:unnamed protein product, partial [Phaeothamnion confervicola]
WRRRLQRAWCARELGSEVAVITCMSRDKHRHAKPGSILIDDRHPAWEAAGGVFVHHTSTATTVVVLERLLGA